MAERNAQPVVLSISHHPGVLASHNAVLESAGFRVLGTMDGAECLRLLREQPIDLLVLGDSIAEQERHNLAQKAREVSPRTRIVMVYRTGDSSPFTRVADAYVGSLDGPQALIEEARELTRSRDTARADD